MPMPHLYYTRTEHDLYMLATWRVSRMILEYSRIQVLIENSTESSNHSAQCATFQLRCQINTSHCVRFWCFQYLGLITDTYSAPEHTIRPSLEFYYHLGLNDKQIESNMKDHYDTGQFGLGYAMALHQLNTINAVILIMYILTRTSSIKRLRRKWGLKSTRQQQHTLKSIASAIQTIRKSYPSRGAEMIQKQLRIEFDIRAPRWAYPCLIRFYSKSMQRRDHGLLKEVRTRCCQGSPPSALQAQTFLRSRC